MPTRDEIEVDELTVDEAARRIDEFHVVDVREEEEFVGPLGHIAGAVLLPLGDLERWVPELPEGRTLLIACRSGRRSHIACARLAELGRPGAVNLAGGMLAWNEAGLPVAGRREDGADE